MKRNRLLCILTAAAMLFGSICVYGAQNEADDDAWKENTGIIDVTELKFTGSGVKIDGKTVLITEGGDFTLMGENTDVTVHVKSDEKVKLRLEGVKITNSSNPVIFFEDVKKGFITVSKGSENYLTDTGEYKSDAKACVFSNDDLEIKGEGTLYVTSKAHHALAGDDDIKIEEGTIVLVSEAKDGIHVNNTCKILGGDIRISAKGDGIQAEEDVVIEGGKIDITTTGEVETGRDLAFGRGGMGGFERMERENMPRGKRGERNTESSMIPGGNKSFDGSYSTVPEMPEGGRMPFDRGSMSPHDGAMAPQMGIGMPLMEEASAAEESSSEPAGNNTPASTKGIKGETNVEIKGGSIAVNANDHAIHCAATITVSGGELKLTSNYGKGISSHGNLLITGGMTDIVKASEGIESKANLEIRGGVINITASDDGINAGGTGGRDAIDRQNKAAATGHDLLITGGKIFVNAQGDGIDSNGRIVITGGDIVVEGPTNNGNGALDSGGSINVSGGTLIALGASGMAEMPDTDSAQASFKLNVNETIPQGTQITIKNAYGEVLYTYVTLKTGNSIVFSSPGIKSGEAYTVAVGSAVHEIKMTSNATASPSNSLFGNFGGRRW